MSNATHISYAHYPNGVSDTSIHDVEDQAAHVAGLYREYGSPTSVEIPDSEGLWLRLAWESKSEHGVFEDVVYLGR